jgi:pimeloyl-ACP methyl ester carboxylesterase
MPNQGARRRPQYENRLRCPPFTSAPSTSGRGHKDPRPVLSASALLVIFNVMDSNPSTRLPTERLRDWYAQGAYFAFGEHRIFFRKSDNWHQATQPILVLIHGFPTASFDWHVVWDGLSGHFRLLALDLLGFGCSSKPYPHRYSILEQADVVESLIDEMKVEVWHLLVHDYGDTVAQELLARQIAGNAPRAASRLGSAVLLNGGLFPETHRPRLIQRLLLSPIGPWIARRLNRQRFGASFSAVFAPSHQPSDIDLDEFWSLIAVNDGQRLATELIRYIPERRQYRERWCGALTCTQLPLRFVNGLDDPISGAHMVARYRALIGAADVVELPGIGHYPQIETPQSVIDAVVSLQRF